MKTTIKIKDKLHLIEKPLVEDFEFDGKVVRAPYPINENNDIDIVVMDIADSRFSPYKIGDKVNIDCSECENKSRYLDCNKETCQYYNDYACTDCLNERKIYVGYCNLCDDNCLQSKTIKAIQLKPADEINGSIYDMIRVFSTVLDKKSSSFLLLMELK